MEPQRMRESLLRGIPEASSLYGQKPEPRFVYFPPSHTKALRPDALVVIGMRGAGKSFWWAALQDPAIRKLVAQIDRHAEIGEKTEIALGFGEQPNIRCYPDKDILQALRRKWEPRMIWRTVIVHNLLPGRLSSIPEWQERVEWVAGHPQDVARWMEEKDQELHRQQVWALVLFDALDRATDDWNIMYDLIRGLLQVALDLRPFRRLRVKCFLRTDQVEESRIATFPDASKVMTSSITLGWLRQDLYGLFWQYLANTQEAKEFREFAEREFSIRWDSIPIDGQTIWQWPRLQRDDEDLHRKLFHTLTGPWMGRDGRRGFPYSWLPGHLADARGRTSPRSFLAALRAAAEDTQQRYPEHEYTLHYESIKRGVQSASQIRVRELREDYPWVDVLMQPLRGLVVPCEFQSISEQWEQKMVLKMLEEWREKAQKVKLLPAHLEDGYEGLRQDLEELCIFFRLQDGRVNIPDVFRVGYGLGRKGGVRPLREQGQ